MIIRTMYKLGGSRVVGIPDSLAGRLGWRKGDCMFYSFGVKGEVYVSNEEEKIEGKIISEGGEVTKRILVRRLIKCTVGFAVILPTVVLGWLELNIKSYVGLIEMSQGVIKLTTEIWKEGKR